MTPIPSTTTTTLLAPAVRVQHATKCFGSGQTAVRALDDVTLDIRPSAFTAVMGASGSGKSTLLHCMAGLDTLTSGRAFVGERDLAELDDRALTVLRRERVGFVFQEFNLLPTLNALDNIRLPFTLGGRSPDADWVDEIVTTLGLTQRVPHRPSELSGGEQQRVAIARALVTRPDVVFGDEPTGNLDSHAGAQVLGFLRRAVDDFGQTIVMVTHDPVAAAHADSVVFLADGRVVDEMWDPTAARVLERMTAFGS